MESTTKKRVDVLSRIKQLFITRESVFFSVPLCFRFVFFIVPLFLENV